MLYGINSTSNSGVSIASDIISILRASKCNLLKTLLSFAAGLLYPVLDLLFLLWLTCSQVRCLLGVASHFPAQLFSLTSTVSVLPACFLPRKVQERRSDWGYKTGCVEPSYQNSYGCSIWSLRLYFCIVSVWVGNFKVQPLAEERWFQSWGVHSSVSLETAQFGPVNVVLREVSVLQEGPWEMPQSEGMPFLCSQGMWAGTAQRMLRLLYLCNRVVGSWSNCIRGGYPQLPLFLNKEKPLATHLLIAWSMIEA